MTAQTEHVLAATRARIELSGTLRAEIGGREVGARLPGRQGRALFAYLVVNRHRPVSRAELIDVLWPAAPPEAPEAGLSTVLARVRRAVGDGVVEGRGELRIVLDPDADVDIERAEAAAETAERALENGDPRAARAAAEAALEVIDRPLLPGIEGDWIDSLRGELEALEPGLLEVLARAALLVGDREHLAIAERLARLLAERHQFRESGHALLIEIHGRRGNVAEATLAYDRLRVLLRDELGTVPSSAVSALHEQLLRDGRLPGAELPAPPAPAAPGQAAGSLPLPLIGGAAAATPFVGRDEQLERLRAAWLEAGMGERRLALLVGEAGVGKTRLAARFAAEVHRAGAGVLFGRCDEEPLRSYQPFIEALRHELRHGGWDADPDAAGDLARLARILPEARPESVPADRAQDPETERYDLFEAVASLVRRATERAPLLLVLDDLHWADKPTLLLLRHLLRHADPARLMVLGLARDIEAGDDPLSELVADLHRERRFDRIPLDGFSDEETDALVAARLAAQPSGAFVRGLRVQTEGNPFFMEEALRALVEAQVLETGAAAPVSALESIGVPDSVADIILRRLSRVSELARDALTIGATIGPEFGLDVVEALLDAPADGVLEALEEAMASGLIAEVTESVDRFAFGHVLARDAIYDRLSRTRRLRLHLRVATALESTDASAGELARHFFAAREIGVADQAVRYAVLAGEEAAASLAYEESVEHYRRALAVLADDPEADESRRCDILLALGRVQWRAGDPAARRTYLEAVASARRRGAAEQLGWAALGLGEQYWESTDASRREARLIADAVQALPREDSKLRARLMGRMAEHQHFTAEDDYGRALSADALAVARRVGDPETLAMALMSRHVTLLDIEHLDERVALSDEAVAVTAQHRALHAEALNWRLVDACERGAVDDAARRDNAELARITSELRQPALEWVAIGWQGAFAHMAGNVEAAERYALRSFKRAGRAQVGTGSSALAGMLYSLRRQQGRLGELLPTMETLRGGKSATLAWSAALALAQVETGAVEAGRARYEQLAARARAMPRNWYWFFTLALIAETCCALHDTERAQELYDLLAPYADRFVQVVFTVNWGSAQRHLGMLAAVLERFDVAEEHFRAALAANERIGSVLMTAETQCAYGALLLRRGAAGDRARAATLAGLAEQVAVPRALDGLQRRARALTAGRG